jgi:hypothetical protein
LVRELKRVSNVTIFPGFPPENACHWRWKNFPFGIQELYFRILAISFHDIFLQKELQSAVKTLTSLTIRNSPFLNRAVSQCLMPGLYGLRETVQQEEINLVRRRGKPQQGG